MKAKKNKQDIVKEVAKRSKKTMKETNAFLDVLLDVLAENFADGNDINFTNFGKFEIIETKEREGINPQKPSQHITIPAYSRVYFKSSAFLKSLINGTAEV